MAAAIFCACAPIIAHVSSHSPVGCSSGGPRKNEVAACRRISPRLHFWGLSKGDRLSRFREFQSFAGAGRRKEMKRESQIVWMVMDCGGDFPPQSREETLEQAGASLSSLLQKALKAAGPTTVKQRKSLRQQRLRVDIPVLDESPEALFSLTLDLIESSLGDKKFLGAVTVYLPSALLEVVPTDFVNVSKVLETRFMSLERSEEGCPYDTAVVLIVGPNFGHSQAVDSIARSAGHRPVVVLNGGWSLEEESDQKWGSLLSSFEVAYSFTPLAIQGFFSTTEGAVLKHVKSGAPSGRPWLIFVKEGEKYKCVSSLKRRPNSTDLENALYSSMAANSPVNKSIQFLRGLVSK